MALAALVDGNIAEHLFDVFTTTDVGGLLADFA